MRNRKSILSVTIKRMIDDSPDTSWLGEYAQSPNSEFSIDRAHSEDCIENDSIQKDKLERIAASIEDNRDAVCEEHIDKYLPNTTCEECISEIAEQNAIDCLRELAECDCGERGDMQRHEYRYFNPSFNYVDEKGHASPDNTPEEVRKYVRQDYERMEGLNRGHWCFMGISAEAVVLIPSGTSAVKSEVSSGCCFGMESDSPQSDIDEMEKEQLHMLRSELKNLGFSSRAISTAFKNIERKED